jgi:ankyrin repeat protein
MSFEAMKYERWSREELEEECAKRGVKTMGSKELLIDRLDTWDAAAARSRLLSRKRKPAHPAVSEEEQRELDLGLLRASKASLADVRAALSRGASVNCVGSDRYSPLMLACERRRDWSVAEAIVNELLLAGAVVDICSESMLMAIHLAAMYSSRAMVKLLLDARSLVDPRSADGWTPLHLCCEREDEEALEIARVLLDRGGSAQHPGRHYRTPLMSAARDGTAAMVALLLSHGADVHAVDEEKKTALHLAAQNRMHGPAIIPLLVEMGADINARDADGDTALVWALSSTAELVRALAPLYQPAGQLCELLPAKTCSDPVGCVQEGLRFGVCVTQDDFSAHLSPENPACYSWALLRMSGASTSAVFGAMATCQDPEVWRWAGLEMRTPRHPDSHGTLLHLAAASNNAAAVRALTSIWLNPLLRNREGRLPVELTTDASIRATLLEYMALPPQREVMRWYGPYLQERVRTFLLVLQRWKNERVRVLSRNVVDSIILQMRAAEACDTSKAWI